MIAKVIKIHLPEYNIKKKPNYVKLGKKVDKVIEKSFPDGRYILRAISSSDHKGITLNRLAKIILETGTDKYDPGRKEVSHEEFSGYNHDMQAGIIKINNRKLVIPKSYKYPTEFGDTIYHFYEHAPLDRDYPLRIDLLLLYYPQKLKKAKRKSLKTRRVKRRLAKFLYKFKDPENKKDALLGIVKITK